MYSLACHEGQLCLCFMALDKIDVIKNAKKNTLKQNKTTTMAKQTNKNTGPISCHLDRRNSVKKAFIMYIVTPKFLLVRSKQNLFQRARQTYTSILLTGWLFTTLEIRTWKLGQVSFHKDSWDCYWGLTSQQTAIGQFVFPVPSISVTVPEVFAKINSTYRAPMRP